MMDTAQTEGLCREIVTGCTIAESALDALLHRAKGYELICDLERLQRRYRDINEDARHMLRQMGIRYNARHWLPEVGSRAQVFWQTLLNRSPEKIAHIVIRGFETGRKDLRDFRRDYVNAEGSAKALCEDLLAMQAQERQCFCKYLN